MPGRPGIQGQGVEEAMQDCTADPLVNKTANKPRASIVTGNIVGNRYFLWWVAAIYGSVFYMLRQVPCLLVHIHITISLYYYLVSCTWVWNGENMVMMIFIALHCHINGWVTIIVSLHLGRG